MTQVHGSGPGRIPSEIDAVTVGWLTEALRADPALPDTATVTEMRAEQIAMDSGFSSLLYRLYLGGEDVPATVIVKLAAQSEARGAMDLLGGYRRELAFYQRVAGHAPIATPHVHAARMVEGSVDFVLVMEDLQQWVNADHLAGLSLERARVAIDQLAGLHAWSITVADPTLINEFPSLDTPMARDLFLPVFGLGWQVYLEHSSRTVPMPVARFAERFVELAPQALAALTERAMLLHGDIRADNMFFDGDRLKVVDFQFASHGAGAADIGYLVSQGLPSEVRRGHDEALVREYLDKLGSHGFVDYHFDEAWRHYRFAVAYLMVLPVITLVGWDSMPERSRQLCLTLVDRAVAAIDDIDALEVFA
ncbi:phosphotransferase [Mycolicibacterium fortuitum]|uniref:phosphotransferase n=1 Tax=Mycolicibacterium fortuitum TaxID=1766 RepID=UPI0009BCB5CA|nr:phosphotransferase [Mycolicibacterium fortuitum]